MESSSSSYDSDPRVSISSSDSDYLDDDNHDRTKSKFHKSARQKILSAISVTSLKISKYRKMILSEDSIKNLEDEYIRSFVSYDALRKYDPKYKEAIRELQSHEEKLAGLGVFIADDQTKTLHEAAMNKIEKFLSDMSNTVKKLHIQAQNKNIIQGVKPLNISEMAVPPYFNGKRIYPNHFYEFKKKFKAYCRKTYISFEASSSILMGCLQKEASDQIKLKFPSDNNPPAEEIMDCLQQHFGEPQFIINQIRNAHIEAKKIDDLASQNFSSIHNQTLIHIDLMNKMKDITDIYPNSLENTYYCETVLSLLPYEERVKTLSNIMVDTKDLIKFEKIKKALDTIALYAHKNCQISEAISGFSKTTKSKSVDTNSDYMEYSDRDVSSDHKESSDREVSSNNKEYSSDDEESTKRKTYSNHKGSSEEGDFEEEDSIELTSEAEASEEENSE